MGKHSIEEAIDLYGPDVSSKILNMQLKEIDYPYSDSEIMMNFMNDGAGESKLGETINRARQQLIEEKFAIAIQNGIVAAINNTNGIR